MKFLCCILCINVMVSFGQSNHKNFIQLSGPAKKWVLLHPLKAKKALRISLEAQRVSDSIQKTKLLDGDAAGGQVDAFRHAYWMARLRQEIGKCAARSLGKAHEKENYGTFKKNKLEDGVLPDKISSTMDLHNNEEGLKLTIRRSKTPKKGLIYKTINAIKQGNMKIIKKNKEGNFLTCDEKIIRLESLKGKWENNKCLVSSNQTYLKLF